jgi:hypothetical protein
MHIFNKTQYGVNKLKLMYNIMSITKSEMLILTGKYKFSFSGLIFRTASCDLIPPNHVEEHQRKRSLCPPPTKLRGWVCRLRKLRGDR